MNTKRPAIIIRSEAIFTTIWKQIQTEIFRPSEICKPFFNKRPLRKRLVFSEIMHDAVVPRLCSVTRVKYYHACGTTHWLAEEPVYNYMQRFSDWNKRFPFFLNHLPSQKRPLFRGLCFRGLRSVVCVFEVCVSFLTPTCSLAEKRSKCHKT